MWRNVTECTVAILPTHNTSQNENSTLKRQLISNNIIDGDYTPNTKMTFQIFETLALKPLNGYIKFEITKNQIKGREMIVSNLNNSKIKSFKIGKMRMTHEHHIRIENITRRVKSVMVQCMNPFPANTLLM